MEVELLWRHPNAPTPPLLGGLGFLRLAEFVRCNRAAIGGPSKRQPMNSLVSSCLGSTCYAQTPLARYWRVIKAAANEITPKVIAQTPKFIKLMYKGAFRLCNFVSNFLVAREKLLRKLQARAIFRTRRGWIFIAWIFIARNFIAQ